MKNKPIIYLGSDHGGFQLKEQVKKWLSDWGYQYQDIGNQVFDETDDYPLFAVGVAKKVSFKPDNSLGILACRSAAGMVISANKVKNIRAVTAFDVKSAVHSREHNNANVLALSGDFLSAGQAKKVLAAWLKAGFLQGRHQRRLEQLSRLEQPASVEVIPGIFTNNLVQLKKQINLVKGLSDWIQLDLADGELVDNVCLLDPRGLKGIAKKVKLEIHLMVQCPADYVAAWAKAGAKRLIAHVEADDLNDFIKACRKYKVECGLAVDLPTKIEKVKPWISKVDCFLIMTVKAGRSGQTFSPEALAKVSYLKNKAPKKPVALDGGINNITAAMGVLAGANRLVSTSYLFGSKNLTSAINRLKNLN